MQVISRLLAAGLCWIAAVSTSHAESSRFEITLSPPSLAPAHLCVVIPMSCGSKSTPCPLGGVALSDVSGVIEHHAGRRYGVRSPLPNGLPREVNVALQALIRTPPEHALCNGTDDGACDPEFELDAFMKSASTSDASSAAPPPAQIVCRSRNDTAPATGSDAHAAPDAALRARIDPPALDGDLRSHRVAFVALTLLEPVHVQDLRYTSNTLSVLLDRKSPTRAEVQVVGGDYAASSTSAVFSTDQPAIVPLAPRCARFIAEAPPHAAEIASVSLSSPSLHAIAAKRSGRRCTAPASDLASSSPVRSGDALEACPDVTCVPQDRSSRRIAIMLPVTAPDEEKHLVVTYNTNPPTTSEVRWSDAEPSTPLELGLRSIRFSWRPAVGCLADRWTEPSPAAAQRTWSQSCPRAVLSTAMECSVQESRWRRDGGAQPSCEYHCAVKNDLPSPSLPISVTFERVRADVSGPPSPQPALEEVLYSWHDRLEFSGQELTSVVASADRRVMLEFPDPSAWEDRLGDEIDAIRVSSGQSTTQFDLLARYHTEVPPRWVSLPSAGRTCSDRVRIAIVGTRHYDEASLEAKGGRIVLAHPDEYRSVVPYGLFGAGQLFRHPFSNARSATFGDLGLGAQFALPGPGWRAWSIDLEATGQLTHTFYEGIELSDRQKADFTAVPYLRFDLRVALEWWLMRHVGVSVALGAGLGTPLDAGDAHLVGALRTSALFELQPVFTMFPRRLWFMPGAGCRGLENHPDYHTDFIGSPTPRTESDLQCYLFLRFRAALD